MSDTYGVIEAQRRFRDWAPELKTLGQRAVYGALLGFFSVDGTASPTYGQLAQLVGMHPSSVRKIIGQIEEIGAVMRVGDRPILSASGLAHGGRVVIWSFPKRASEGATGESHVRREPVPSAPRDRPKRASEGAPLNVEMLKALRAIEECARCGEDGYVDINDNTRAKCSHQVVA